MKLSSPDPNTCFGALQLSLRYSHSPTWSDGASPQHQGACVSNTVPTRIQKKEAADSGGRKVGNEWGWAYFLLTLFSPLNFSSQLLKTRQQA